MESIELFDLNINCMSFEESVLCLKSDLETFLTYPKIVVTPNVDHIVRIHKNNQLFKLYKTSDYIFADGFPVVLASRLFFRKKSLPERITGADLFPELCRLVSKMNGKVFLLGGHPGQEQFLKERFNKKYPNIKFEILSPEFGFSADSSTAFEAANRINIFKPDVTFVCLGMPRQELWAFKFRHLINTKLICCFGAAFEFELGVVKRAPIIFQKIGFEWLWRLLCNPGKLAKRYLIDDLYFFKLLFKELFK